MSDANASVSNPPHPAAALASAPLTSAPLTSAPLTSAPLTWQTKHGPRRVRRNPPTLAEALTAAQGLTDDREQQVALAAELMGVPAADARAELRRLAPDRRATLTMMAPSRDKGARTVVVERKVSRRFVTPPPQRAGGALRPR